MSEVGIHSRLKRSRNPVRRLCGQRVTHAKKIKRHKAGFLFGEDMLYCGTSHFETDRSSRLVDILLIFANQCAT